MKTNVTYRKYLTEADCFFAIAQREYEAGKKENNDKSIRQGAEKAWNASVQATKAIALKMTGKIPRSYNAQWQFLNDLIKKNTTNGYLLMAFKEFAKGLHGECFYHGEYELNEMNNDFEQVKHFIDEIKKICHNGYEK